MTSKNIVYMERVPAEVQEIIRSRLPIGFDLEFRSASTTVEQAVANADFILVATTKVTSDLLDASKQLRLIQHQGVGYDNIDLDAARSRGIPVAICPEGTSVGVAEHFVLLVLSIYRRLLEADQSTRDGKWLQWELRSGSFELAGKTIGLIGMGRIGKEVAKRLRGFDVEILYYDPVRTSEETERSLGITFALLDEILPQADIVSLHLPLTSDTRGLFNASAFCAMKESAILINTARGGLVNEDALIEALRTGQIAAAGLDVYETEPLATDSPLRLLTNTVLTPHIAAGTEDALRAKMDACFANIVAISQGREPENRIV